MTKKITMLIIMMLNTNENCDFVTSEEVDWSQMELFVSSISWSISVNISPSSLVDGSKQVR